MAGPWYYYHAATAGGNGLSWATARQSLATMTSVVAGDSIYVAHDHAEPNSAANLVVTFPGTPANPNLVICVRRDGSVPPVSADWATTAEVRTTGTFSITLSGSAYFYGIKFIAALTSNAIAGLSVAQTGVPGCWQYFDNCVLRLATTSTSASSRLTLGATGNNVGSRITLDNTQIDLAHVAQNITGQGRFEWRNTAVPFPNQVPTTMIAQYNQPFTFTFEAVDFLLMDAGKTFFGAGLTYYPAAFYGCRIGGGGTIAAALTTPGSDILLCHAGVPTNPGMPSRLTHYIYEGTEQIDVTVCRAGGANDSTRAYSRTYLPNANTLPHRPFSGLPITAWNGTANADVTVTLYWVWNNSAVPYNYAVWFEVQYFGDSGSPLMTIDHCGPQPNYLANGTQWISDDSDWTAGIAVTRANSTFYGANTVLKFPSNPRRIFFCTTGGTTAASEPAAFATAVDGQSGIQDGTAFFRCGTRFKTQLTLTAPQVKIAGPIYIVPKLAYMTGTVPFIWLDPVIG